MASAPRGPVPFEDFNFSSEPVDSAAIYALSLDEAKILRGIIFGRHGRKFADDAVIQDYLAGKPWYKPDSAFTNARLNETEMHNLDVIRGAEAAKHATIEPGDLRFFGGRAITTTMLGSHSASEWKMLASEVWAMRGHQFNDIPSPDDEFMTDSSESLQLYYNDRYWYKPVGVLKRKDLPPDDRARLDTIDLARIRNLGDWVTFGRMRLFQHALLTEKNLVGNGLISLRLMRNEFYALHGRPFTTPWLKPFFARYEGYAPRPDFKESDLTDVERANILLIKQVEDRKHAELSTRAVDGREFLGMPLKWVRLLRNEIYARHGRIFKDRALQSYFATLPWYKPNPAFSEAMLTPVEKMNALAILEHEGKMRRGEKYPEG